MWTYTNSDELYHWGVKGMRWGVRRYQNPDGTLTPAGRKKAQKLADKERRKADKLRKKELRNDVKNRRLLSDQELAQKIRRLEQEKKLRELTDNEINQGKNAVSEVLMNSGKQVAQTVLKGAALYGIKAAMEQKFSLTEAAAYVAPKPKNK